MAGPGHDGLRPEGMKSGLPSLPHRQTLTASHTTDILTERTRAVA